MSGTAFSIPRMKVQLKLSLQRLQICQEKRSALAKKARRDIADLLSKQKLETAKIRVETVIGDEIMIELLELLSLYAEVLLARVQLLEMAATEPDPLIMDAVCAVIYAAPRQEVKELMVVRDILMHKFGRAFSITVVNDAANVPSRVLNKLKLFVPPPELVDGYLIEIARTYGVSYTGMVKADDVGLEKLTFEDDDDASGGGDVTEKKADNVEATKPDTDTPTPEASSSMTTQAADDPANKKPPSTGTIVLAPPPAYKVVQKESELDELQKRFDALKKR